MLMRSGMALLFYVSCLLPLQGQEVELAWKFAKSDKPFYQKLKSSSNQVIKIQNQSISQQQEMEFIFAWTVKEVDANKIVLEQKIEAVMTKIVMGGNEVKYDSLAKDANENPLSSFFKPILGSTFTITLNPTTYAVMSVGGRDEFAKKLSDANPQTAQLLKSILSEDQLKQMQEHAFTVLPDKGKKVKVGDPWERTGNLSMGPLGSYNTKYTYKYAGTEKRTIDGKELNLHKIELKSTLTYKAPDTKDAGGLPFKIEGSSKLDAPEATGVIYFDAETGRVVESKMDVKITGKLDLVVMDSKSEVELNMTMKTESTISDKNLAEAPK